MALSIKSFLSDSQMTVSTAMLCHVAESRILFIIMLNVVMLRVVMLNTIMLNAIMLNVVILSVVALHPSVSENRGLVWKDCIDIIREPLRKGKARYS